jgi:hypothetical protein
VSDEEERALVDLVDLVHQRGLEGHERRDRVVDARLVGAGFCQQPITRDVVGAAITLGQEAPGLSVVAEVGAALELDLRFAGTGLAQVVEVRVVGEGITAAHLQHDPQPVGARGFHRGVDVAQVAVLKALHRVRARVLAVGDAQPAVFMLN